MPRADILLYLFFFLCFLTYFMHLPWFLKPTVL
jgi:hypothetical protein